MSIFWIKQPDQGLVGTGNCSARTEWDQGPDGKPVRTDRLARDEATGFPLWEVEVAYTQVVYGRASLVTAKVLVPSEVEPTGNPYAPVLFEGLRVETRLDVKAVRMVEYWRADALAGAAAVRPAAAGGRGRAEGEATS